VTWSDHETRLDRPWPRGHEDPLFAGNVENE
jgi:hypothetical protein